MSIPSLATQIQGQGTVSADNLNTYVQTAQTSSELRDFTGLPGMVVMLQGITVSNDGNGGWFYWNPTGTEPDDNLNYIVPSGTSSGEWVRLLFPVSTSSGIFTTITASGLVQLNSDVIVGGILSESLVTGLSGAGTTQGTATPLTANLNIATTVAANSGFILPLITASGDPIKTGTSIKLFNRGANTANVYPPSSGQIESVGTNNPIGAGVNDNPIFTFAGSGQWWVS